MGELIIFQPKNLYQSDVSESYYNPCTFIAEGRNWCPKTKWFLQEPCPFYNRYECDLYQEACGMH